MPDIKELGYQQVAIQLSEDKQITLGPRETKRISDDEFESEGVQRSLRDGLIAVLPETQGEKKSKKTESK